VTTTAPLDGPLQQLRDLHLPPAPAFWPPAPGWWLIGVLALVLISVLAWRTVHYYRYRRPYRNALAALERLRQATERGDTGERDAADSINALLKRALIHGAGRSDAAPLTGDAWLRYLDRILGDDLFSNGAGAALGNARFAPGFSFDAVAVCTAARRVIVALQRRKV
jgi:hypothetical protein